MITPFKIENVSYEDIISNVESYVEHFLNSGVLIFKSLNLSAVEQENVTRAFGSKLNWGHISMFDEEDHSFTINMFNKHNYSNSDILIPWHLENSHKNDRQIASTWNMIKLECSDESGTTGFVNTDDILAQMKKEWVLFFRSATVTNSLNDSYNLIDDIPTKPKIEKRSALIPHRNTGKEILNLSPRFHQDALVGVNGQIPSSEEEEEFKLIKLWIEKTVSFYETEPAHWLKWSLGDLVVVDLSKIYHAVKGGFELGQRKFRRYWAYSSFESMQRSI